MAHKTCEDCGSRIYDLGCTWCNEPDYIEQQVMFDEQNQEINITENDDRHNDAK